MAEARTNAARLSPEQRKYLHRARFALDFGELALSPSTTSDACIHAAAASAQFRDAIYWAALTVAPELRASTPETLVGELRRLTGATEKLRELPLEAVVPWMDANFRAFADLPETEQLRVSEVLRRAAMDAVQIAAYPVDRLAALQFQRFMAMLALGLAIIALVAAPLLYASRNIAAGKPWKTSSTIGDCPSNSGHCGPVAVKILFHTNEEENPWFEYDLGSVMSFSSMSIQNRRDALEERAIPLIVEASTDHGTYTEVIRRSEPFKIWNPHFSTQRARYVRLRVPRMTYLHLESVEVFP